MSRWFEDPPWWANLVTIAVVTAAILIEPVGRAMGALFVIGVLFWLWWRFGVSKVIDSIKEVRAWRRTRHKED